MHLRRLLTNHVTSKSLHLLRSSIAMSSSLPPVANRVKDAEPSIWVRLTALAAGPDIVNIGQGFPDYEPPSSVTRALAEITNEVTVDNGNSRFQQYTRGFGHPSLVNELQLLYGELGLPIKSAMDEVLVTIGAYQALYYACLAYLNEGDEAIYIEPAFDCYDHQIRLAGGVPKPVVMTMDTSGQSSSGDISSARLKIDFEKLDATFTSKTRLLIINNPHNPTGKVYDREELTKLALLAKKHNVIVLADEVYEWMNYPGYEMIRFATLPGMWERTITIGSAGKTFSATGWKTGWALAPKDLLHPLRMIHQNCAFTCATNIQEALARSFAHERSLGLAHKDSYFNSIVPEVQGKRDRMIEIVKGIGWRPIIPQAGYFMLVDYEAAMKYLPKSVTTDDFSSPSSDDRSMDFRLVKWLIDAKKLAVIPTTGFCTLPEHKKMYEKYVRVCFFKMDKTIEAAGKILKEWVEGEEEKKERRS